PLLSEPAPDDPEAALTEIVRGWLESTGPQTAATLARTFAVSEDAVISSLLRLEHEGQVLRGHFSSAPTSPANGESEPLQSFEWANRRVLARIHRLTLGRLRREIEPVSTTDYLEFVRRWQHVALGTQLHGVDGTLQVIKQLQGLEYPAQAWEQDVLPTRVTRYRSEWLDKLCASGEVMWGRLSPHPAFDDAEQPRRRRVRPSRVAPVSLFLRETADWLVPRRHDNENALSGRAQAVRGALGARGASFFLELVQATGLLASEVEDALWELVAAGLVTADGFDNLRSLIDPKRRLALGRRNAARPRNAAGRWALLATRSQPADVEAFARQLLLRWGVLSRDVVRRENVAPAWRDLLVCLRRLEAQGEIRGGRFVASHVGEQYALPEAIDLLRAVRRASASSRSSEDDGARSAEPAGASDTSSLQRRAG
ncbi:MAG: DEAD/DEAH box helicase, partial [Candidatus Eremiobacteraeota bacterium]|nr:DEAD/DEAH box helicase [Candidatus Eremiobacteraeota bacterium]